MSLLIKLLENKSASKIEFRGTFVFTDSMELISLMDYTVGAAAIFTIAFLIFLGILVFGAVAIAAFVSFPIFDLDYFKAGLLYGDQLSQGTLNYTLKLKREYNRGI